MKKLHEPAFLLKLCRLLKNKRFTKKEKYVKILTMHFKLIWVEDARLRKRCIRAALGVAVKGEK